MSIETKLALVGILHSFFDKCKNSLNTKYGKNVVANYTGGFVNALAPLIVLPILLSNLGQSMWGLVSFSVFAVNIMSLFNAGLAQALIQAFGVRWSGGEVGQDAAGRLLFSYERIYWAAALLISFLAYGFLDLENVDWLNLGTIPHDVAVKSIICTLLLFLVQFPSSIYRTVISSLQMQVWLNIAQSIVTFVRSIGGVLVVWYTHSVVLYLLFLVVVALVGTLLMRYGAWRLMLEKRSSYQWDISEVKSTFHFSIYMSLLAMLGVLTTQIDKYFISAKLTIDDLGLYAIAYTVSMGVLQIGYPIFTAILPRLIEIGEDSEKRRNANKELLIIMILLIAIVGGFYLSFGRWALDLWLNDSDLAAKVAVILNWLLISSGLNTIYNIAYTNWVSSAEILWLGSVNVISFVFALILTPLFIHNNGVVGAVAAPLTINIVGCLAAVIWMFSRNKYSKQDIL